jgi:hypothetical protein
MIIHCRHTPLRWRLGGAQFDHGGVGLRRARLPDAHLSIVAAHAGDGEIKLD